MNTQISPFAPLIAKSFASLTTFRKTGVAVATAIWFSLENDTIYIYTDAKSGKVKRIRHTSRVTLAPCKASGKVTGDAIEATASIISDPQEIARAEASLARKYGFQWHALHLIGRITDVFQREKGEDTFLRIKL